MISWPIFVKSVSFSMARGRKSLLALGWCAMATYASELASTEVAAERGPAASEPCVDSSEYSEQCILWAAAGECSVNRPFMVSACRHSCGCPPLASGALADATDGAGDAACEDRDKSGNCAHWAAAGECEANRAFMRLKCASSCHTCDELDFGKRCPMPDPDDAAVKPGEMLRTFEMALSNFPELEPQMLSEDPPVISFERFIRDDEVEALLKYGEGHFERSTASGGRSGDEFVPITSEIRTSWTTWCNRKDCLADESVQRLSNRMAAVTRTPVNNSEFIQLLRYLPCEHPAHEDCQFYKRHHDTIPELETLPAGPRVFTFILYLSDVEEGGGTKFDGGFTVQPRKGRAVLWPATHNERPFEQDERTHHEALPVLKGTKFAANFWVHQYDYISAHHAGCTM